VTSSPQPDPPRAGGVHEETARLFAALEGAAAAWAGAPPRTDDRTEDRTEDRTDDGADDGSGAGEAHLPSTCGVCPLCLALDHVGRRHPEVLSHLGEAVQALGAAFAALTADASQQADERAAREPDERTPPRTERIDVDD
jgi:hypothetical protein